MHPFNLNCILKQCSAILVNENCALKFFFKKRISYCITSSYTASQPTIILRFHYRFSERERSHENKTDENSEMAQVRNLVAAVVDFNTTVSEYKFVSRNLLVRDRGSGLGTTVHDGRSTVAERHELQTGILI